MKKGIGDKVLSWFVVTEDEGGGAPAPEEAVADSAEVVVPAPARASVAPPVVRPGQPFDPRAFGEVYSRAGMAAEARERLQRVSDLVASLPAEATLEVKRTIVSASLHAFGVPVAQVVSACDAALGALEAHTAEGRVRTEQVLAEAQARIDRLNAEIAEVKRLVDVQLRAQDELARGCGAERSRVLATRDFFAGESDAEPPARHAEVIRLR